ncbi:Fic family protein [Flavobacterium restrictum]|uniref:Fic family protein n=1 Tax=Flavobacterium restrictum TaxID=2594428 RepID=A0A553E5P4_9FLAO|nr:Fic family protein [Flavobacterium restrictum]TRX40367.1 Fic family protein [Flavobacterium restrictum]
MNALLHLLKQYNEQNVIPSLEEEQALLYEYVYNTNKLEGNQLSLIQTTELFKSDTISGNNIRNSDILEQKGMYKALKRMLLAVKNQEELSTKLILEFNWLAIGNLWNDDYYNNAKEKGQEKNRFKISQNVISIKQNGVEIEKITPLSSPDNVEEKMETLLKTIQESKKNVLDKSVFLAQEIWIHQPFVDGNKRTGRLLINFLLMKEGFPLFSFTNEKSNYNSLLVEQYYAGTPDLVKNYIQTTLSDKMNTSLLAYSKIKKDFKGFRLLL